MKLVSLIYASRLAKGCGPNDVPKILDVSSQNNVKLGITGALCYDSRYFLQCLEGACESVNRLYNDIVRDERHTDVTLLSYGVIEERRFSEWSMAFVRADEVTEEVMLRFGAEKAFDPFELSAAQSVRLLEAVVEERRRFLEEERQRVSGVA